MASLQIRELPQDVGRALAERARSEGRSLAQQAIAELRRLPELAAADRRRRVLAALREQGVRPEASTMPDPVELVREDRDA